MQPQGAGDEARGGAKSRRAHARDGQRASLDHGLAPAMAVVLGGLREQLLHATLVALLLALLQLALEVLELRLASAHGLPPGDLRCVVAALLLRPLADCAPAVVVVDREAPVALCRGLAHALVLRCLRRSPVGQLCPLPLPGASDLFIEEPLGLRLRCPDRLSLGPLLLLVRCEELVELVAGLRLNGHLPLQGPPVCPRLRPASLCRSALGLSLPLLALHNAGDARSVPVRLLCRLPPEDLFRPGVGLPRSRQLLPGRSLALRRRSLGLLRLSPPPLQRVLVCRGGVAHRPPVELLLHRHLRVKLDPEAGLCGLAGAQALRRLGLLLL
mmetsp:Transcript_9530/g.37189  ORF Transcript_9530/g.37189 Transcript_9530/m.37189 type:complete len:328 (-) Transcript_9530:628-1611(-)